MTTVVLAGQFVDFSGYAWAGRAYAKLFKERFDNVLFYDRSVEGKTQNMSKDQIFEFKKSLKIEDIEFCTSKDLEGLKGEVYYFECFMPSINVSLATLGHPHSTFILNSNKNINLKKISLIAWESNKVGNFFLKGLRDYEFDHIIFHTSEHIKELEDQISISCSHNHYPVMELFHPPKKEKRDDEVFRIFSFNDFQPRKGWDTLLSAYYSTFHNHDDVVLRIKTHGNVGDIQQKIMLIKEKNVNINLVKNDKGVYKALKEYPKCKIELDTNFLSEEEIDSYYSNFDLFACTTKGEGFGLTIAQAGLSGLPILCPEKGGHRYFVPDISYTPETFTSAISTGLPMQFYTGKTMHLYECDFLSTKSELKKAYNDWKKDTLFQKGIQTRKFMENKLSTENCFKNILKIMEELK